MTHDTTLLIQYIIHRYYSFVIVGVGLAYNKGFDSACKFPQIDWSLILCRFSVRAGLLPVVWVGLPGLLVGAVPQPRAEGEEILPNLRVRDRLVRHRLQVLLGRVPVGPVAHQHVVERLLVLALQLVHSHLMYPALNRDKLSIHGV